MNSAERMFDLAPEVEDRLSNASTWEIGAAHWASSGQQTLTCCRVVEETHDRVFFEQTKPLFAACLKGMTIAQATQVVDRGVTTLEPLLRSSMPIAVHNALLMDCDRRGFKSS